MIHADLTAHFLAERTITGPTHDGSDSARYKRAIIPDAPDAFEGSSNAPYMEAGAIIQEFYGPGDFDWAAREEKGTPLMVDPCNQARTEIQECLDNRQAISTRKFVWSQSATGFLELMINQKTKLSSLLNKSKLVDEVIDKKPTAGT